MKVISYLIWSIQFKLSSIVFMFTRINFCNNFSISQDSKPITKNLSLRFFTCQFSQLPISTICCFFIYLVIICNFLNFQDTDDDQKMAMLRKAFQMFDTTKSGYIDVLKISTILNTMGQLFDDSELQALIDENDPEGSYIQDLLCLRLTLLDTNKNWNLKTLSSYFLLILWMGEFSWMFVNVCSLNCRTMMKFGSLDEHKS